MGTSEPEMAFDLTISGNGRVLWLLGAVGGVAAAPTEVATGHVRVLRQAATAPDLSRRTDQCLAAPSWLRPVPHDQRDNLDQAHLTETLRATTRRMRKLGAGRDSGHNVDACWLYQ